MSKDNWISLTCVCVGCLPRDIMDRTKYELQYNWSNEWVRSAAEDFARIVSNIHTDNGAYRYRKVEAPKKTHEEIMTMWHRRSKAQGWFKVSIYQNGAYYIHTHAVLGGEFKALGFTKDDFNGFESVRLPPE